MPEGNAKSPSAASPSWTLKDEQRLVKEGYDLLDEKRILLATEIRRRWSISSPYATPAVKREAAAVPPFKRRSTVTA